MSVNGGLLKPLIPVVLAFLLLSSFGALGDDHGDSPLAATPIEVNGLLSDGCIEEGGDMDFFLFRAIAGRTYRLVTSHPSVDMDSVLYLLDTDGQSIVYVDDNSGDLTSSRIVWTCPKDGTYFMMVRHAQATLGTGCYQLSVSVTQLDDHGNNFLSATPMSVEGTPMSGFIEEEGDVDVFLFSVDRGYDYRLSFSTVLTLSITVFSGAGGNVVTQFDTQGDSGEVSFYANSAEPWFVQIHAASDENSGFYEVAIEKQGYGDDHANDASSATVLSVGASEWQGTIEVPDDSDWFQLQARASAEYTFTLSPASESAGYRLSLRSADGQLILEEASTLTTGSLLLQWTAPADGAYFLEISSANGAGSYVLRLSTTLQLQSIGQYNPSGYALDVLVGNSLVYLVIGTKGLLIIDVTDPEAPFEIGSHSTRGYAQAVALYGQTAIIANRGEGVTLLDVSDPSRPIEIGALDTPGSAQSLAVHENLLLIADQREGLLIARFGSADSLSMVAEYQTRGYAAAVASTQDLALIAIGDAGLEIVDISDPSAPVSVSWIDLPGDAQDVTTSGTIAYVATGYRGVRLIDFSVPANPVEVGWLATSEEVMGLAIAGNTLYVAERSAGLSVYSLSDPSDPQRIGQIDTPGEATSVSIGGGYAYVADRQEGLQIIRLLP